LIAYFDTSALVKLLIEEVGSDAAEELWHAADVRLCASVGQAEAAAAVGRAWRMGRIDERVAHAVLVDLGVLWASMAHLPVDEELGTQAARLAVLHGLRGYDAVHLAAAVTGTATLIAGDQALLIAARACRLVTVDVSV
jgi:predicted nucleic acid-binding protein